MVLDSVSDDSGLLGDYPVLRASFEGHTYNVVSRICPVKFLAALPGVVSGNIFSVVLEEFVSSYPLLSNLRELYVPYVELWNHYCVTVNSGNGYFDSVKDELNDLGHEIDEYMYCVSESFYHDFLMDSFFCYRDSSVRDLSVVDDVRCYDWDFEYDPIFKDGFKLLFLSTLIDQYLLKSFSIHSVKAS